MAGNFVIQGVKPVTQEFNWDTTDPAKVLTGFTTLRMSPRKAGIKVNLKSKKVDNRHISFELDGNETISVDHAVCTYLNPARLGPTVQYGHVTLDSVNTEQPPPLSIVVEFKKPYSVTPQMIVWLSALDFPTGSKLAVETRAANITPTGFTLFVTGLMDLPRANNQVSWLAVEDQPGIASGTFVFGKGGSYQASRCHKAITEKSEVFLAFNTFSGPPDLLEWLVEDVNIAAGKLSVKARSVNTSLCSTGVAYIVLPAQGHSHVHSHGH